MVEREHHHKKPGHRRSRDSPYAVASFLGYLGRVECEDEATYLKTDACYIEQPAFQLMVDKTPDTILEEERFLFLQKARSFPGTIRRRGIAATVSSPAGIAEKELQQRRESITFCLQKLYDERKESILELFQQSWVISDHLEDEIDLEFVAKTACRATMLPEGTRA